MSAERTHEHEAIIIAAGSSRRLAHRTQERPKAFLRAGDRTLIERSLDALDAQGFRHVTLVVGYLREVFLRELGPRHRGLSIQYVESPRWHSAGQALSFLLALESWQIRGGPVLFLHADLVYHPKVLADLLGSPHPNLISVDERFRAETRDEVLACGDPHRILRIQKIHEQPRDVLGEVISINKWSASLMHELLEFASSYIDRKGAHGDWESIVDAFLQQGGTAMRPLLCGALPWINVNYENDLVRAADVARRIDAQT